MSSPHTRPDWPQQQPPHAPGPPQQLQPQRADAHVDPPTEPIPAVSDAATQQWAMEPPPGEPAQSVDPEAPTQQWTMEPPPAPRETAPPPRDPAPPQPPTGLPL